MAKHRRFSRDEANELFKYIDGKLYVQAGCSNSNGYRVVTHKEKRDLEHRVIFLMEHGYVPDVIDHIDGNPENNQIENLRAATKSQNSANQKPIRANNTSGARNVNWHKKIGKWAVNITYNKIRKSIGYYDDFELAELVAVEARAKYHGDFSRKEV